MCTRKKRMMSLDRTKAGLTTTGLPKNDVLYEQFILGAKGMARGLLRDKDYSWTHDPLFVPIRLAYGTPYLKESSK
jgi:hypothetical protein